MFEQSIELLKAAAQNVYNVYYLKTLSMYIFNAGKMQLVIGFIIDALCVNFAYLHNLCTVVELHTNLY